MKRSTAAPTTRLEPDDRVPLRVKFSYALGGTTDIFGHWLYNSIANPVFTSYFGLSPTRVSIALSITRLVDAFTDPLFGWLSDNTRSRWGRRRPYILVGSILAGVALPCLFMVSKAWSHEQIFWFMVLSASAYAPIMSAYNMPYQSLGAELTPSYHERTRIMSWKAYTQKLSGMLTGAGFWFATRPWFNDPNTGQPDLARGAMWAGAICGSVMIVAGVMNFANVRERYYAKARTQKKIGFVAMFGETFRCRPYLILLGIALVYAVPTGLFGTLGYYVTTYYVFPGDLAKSAEVTMWSSAFYGVCGIAGVPLAAGISQRLGKKWALTFVLLIGLLAFGSTWWLYTPKNPWLSVLCNGMNGLSATGLWVLLPSMCIDVVDFDELHSHKRLEGAFQSTFAWVLKLGMSASMFVVGPILELTGFNAKLAGAQTPETLLWMRILFTSIPLAAIVAALLLLRGFPLSQEKMLSIRAELEARRGTV